MVLCIWKSKPGLTGSEPALNWLWPQFQAGQKKGLRETHYKAIVVDRKDRRSIPAGSRLAESQMQHSSHPVQRSLKSERPAVKEKKIHRRMS